MARLLTSRHFFKNIGLYKRTNQEKDVCRIQHMDNHFNFRNSQ